MRITLLFIFLALTAVNGIPAQSGLFSGDFPGETGDAAIAEQYLLWAERASAAGQWDQARAALVRAGDYAGISSDLSYLLAVAMDRDNENRETILLALEKAIETRRWTRYTEADARLIQAEHLLVLRRYSAALETLTLRRALAGDNADSAVMQLRALDRLAAADISYLPEFRRYLQETMDRYPRDTRPLRILFNFAARQEPAEEDFDLLELALRRLPFLLETDPELAWIAAPFITDDDQARRTVGAYRSGSFLPQAGNFKPNPASIIPALNLGLLDDIDAIDELFSGNISDEMITLDKDIIITIGSLLRSGEARDYLVRKLHSFTGTIIEDTDHDGFHESRARYEQGVLSEFLCDLNQNGAADLVVVFDFGNPRQGEIPSLPAAGHTLARAVIHWERYPSVSQILLGNETYLFAPGAFQFSPIAFDELCATETYSGLFSPRYNPLNPGLSRRMLSSFAVSVRRPCTEFEGGMEHIYLERGIPVRAEVTLNTMTVSVTEFENGSPVIQRLDLDRDGRMETVRRFHRVNIADLGADTVLDYRHLVESSESDWDGDGIFEYHEQY
ncbi:MAG: tetratricopeptide repeat protein [Treponema sp.]|nr:tetratricopeptide repeat protein [Treponema sp.]